MYYLRIKISLKLIGVVWAGNSRLPGTQRIIQRGVGGETLNWHQLLASQAFSP